MRTHYALLLLLCVRVFVLTCMHNTTANAHISFTKHHPHPLPNSPDSSSPGGNRPPRVYASSPNPENDERRPSVLGGLLAFIPFAVRACVGLVAAMLCCVVMVVVLYEIECVRFLGRQLHYASKEYTDIPICSIYICTDI